MPNQRRKESVSPRMVCCLRSQRSRPIAKIKPLDRFGGQCRETPLERINIAGRIGMNPVGQEHPKGLRKRIDPETDSSEAGVAEGTDRKQVAPWATEIRIDDPYKH